MFCRGVSRGRESPTVLSSTQDCRPIGRKVQGAPAEEAQLCKAAQLLVGRVGKVIASASNRGRHARGH
eukprot:3864077-Lingulodinium_polyedra.AAC.1